VREGIFFGAQIKKLFEAHDFEQNSMVQKEKPGRHLKKSEEPFWTMKNTKISAKL
jgi:hypothetical protein